MSAAGGADAARVDGRAATALERIARGRQREGRVPGLFAGVARHGDLVWGAGVGAADVNDIETPPGADDQFLIASNTKTFTAVLVMRLRDEGKLSLDDPIDTHLPEVAHRGVTIRSMLAHASGLQREPVGDVWDTLTCPDRDELMAGFNQAERVGRAHQYFHYSNLAYSVLGELVARLDGRPWAESLQERILDPLEMTRTTVGPSGRAVTGYFVPPYTDVAIVEPVMDQKALAPCAALASTPADLARWSGFVADPVDEVLSPDTLAEMVEPQIVADPVRWQAAIGLGFMLARSGDRVLVGHTGGVPGHITGVFTDRETGTGGIALMNNTAAPDPAAFAVELATTAIELSPEAEPAWRPGSSVPAELADLGGLWFSEGRPFVFSVREGRLEARAQDQAAHVPPARFAQVGPDLYRTVAGRERGELLRITRDADGRVHHLHWATYLVTREPLAFGQRP
jgi:CubicO group peptidase (beta-lactamase class C family)